MKIGDIVTIDESIKIDEQGWVLETKEVDYTVVLITSKIILVEDEQGNQIKFDK